MNINFVEDYVNKCIAEYKQQKKTKAKSNLYLLNITKNSNNNTTSIKLKTESKPIKYSQKKQLGGKTVTLKKSKKKIKNKKKKRKKNIKIKKEKKDVYGLTTMDNWNKFVSKYAKEYEIRYNKIKTYVNKYTKLHGQSPNIHISLDPINICKFKKRPGFWIESHSLANPNGMWFACGTAWLDWKNRLNINQMKKDIMEYKYINIEYSWFPINVYSLELDNLNIKEIKNCRQFNKFNKEYVLNKPKNMGNKWLDWKKITKEYDGLRICPYMGKCNPYIKKRFNQIYNFHNYPMIASDALLGKIKSNDVAGLWHLHWETDTGVIFKNFKNVLVKQII